ncbi:MAG: hypothetical protein ACYTHM_03470 [Planctomycetota bacterium]
MEPRWKNLQYRRPHLIQAVDDTGKVYRPIQERGGWNEWQDIYKSIISLDDRWAAVELKNIPEAATAVTSLKIALPIRRIHTMKELIVSVNPAQFRPETKTLDSRTFTLDQFAITGKTIRATLTVRGKEVGGWGTYKFALKKGGREFGHIYSRGSTSSRSEISFELEGRLMPRQTIRKGCMFVVSYPGTTTVETLEFEFKDLKLP